MLWEDGERVLCRGWRDDGNGVRTAVLAVLPASEHPTPGLVGRLAHEYGLKDELDGRSAVRPLALVREHDRTVLLLEDPGGDPFDRLRQLHEPGLINKDIKPVNVLVNSATGRSG